MRRLSMTAPCRLRRHVVDVAVDDQQISPAVQVEVGEHAAEPQTAARNPSEWPARGYIVKRAVLAGPEQRQHLVVEIRHGDALRAGAVEVRDGNAHAGPRLAVLAKGHSGSQRDLFEAAVAAIAIQLVGLRIVSHE